MKTINVKPIEEINLQFTDGTAYTCSFNMLAMAYMQEEVTKLPYESYDKIPTNVMLPIIIYCGIKANHEDFTYEEAVELTKMLSLEHYKTIIGTYKNSMIPSDEKSEKKTRTSSSVKK